MFRRATFFSNKRDSVLYLGNEIKYLVGALARYISVKIHFKYHTLTANTAGRSQYRSSHVHHCALARARPDPDTARPSLPRPALFVYGLLPPETPKMSDPPFLRTLPKDLLERILKLAGPQSTRVVAGVCHDLRVAADSPTLWRGFFEERWGAQPRDVASAARDATPAREPRDVAPAARDAVPVRGRFVPRLMPRLMPRVQTWRERYSSRRMNECKQCMRNGIRENSYFKHSPKVTAGGIPYAGCGPIGVPRRSFAQFLDLPELPELPLFQPSKNLDAADEEGLSEGERRMISSLLAHLNLASERLPWFWFLCRGRTTCVNLAKGTVARLADAVYVLEYFANAF